MSEKIKLTKKELHKILRDHELWVESGGFEGDRADLTNADLQGVNLRCMKLCDAILTGADLREADLREADLKNAWLDFAWLESANLDYAFLGQAHFYYATLDNASLKHVSAQCADFKHATMWHTNLEASYLVAADFYEARLPFVNLKNADCKWARFDDISISGTNREGATNLPPIACPEEGSFIGYKKAMLSGSDRVIVKLLIPEDAKRSSATSTKCRCSKAKVLSITNIDGESLAIDQAFSTWDRKFIYIVGETVEVEDFDDNRWNECAPGIHFFLSRQDAVNY